MDLNIPYIDKIVSIIVSLIDPDQIVLFGSYARGDNKIKVPVDLLVLDYDKYNNLKNEIGYIYKTISKEGKLIYGTV